MEARSRVKTARESSCPPEPSQPGQDEGPVAVPGKRRNKSKPTGRGQAWAKGQSFPGTPGGYPKGSSIKLSDERVIQALEAMRGNRSAAARKLNVHPTTVFNYLADRPHLKE